MGKSMIGKNGNEDGFADTLPISSKFSGLHLNTRNACFALLNWCSPDLVRVNFGPPLRIDWQPLKSLLKPSRYAAVRAQGLRS
ncbi:hypothetical protein [Parasphingorhabdus sp.]|uniref:hypothetical protein n=1 Tax=Parasphingorhabdus sp. TaxID=2709688 RepID=UPI003BAF6479